MESIPELTATKPHPPSLDNEKYEKDEKIETTAETDLSPKLGGLTDTDIGEVFNDGPRLIDLGTDGKERPIGMLSAL